jgi:hypothetical protein
MSRAKQKELSALLDDPVVPFDSLRTFTFEEEADDVSARVLFQLGIDPRGEGLFLLRRAPAGYAQACLDTIASGRTPYYGGLADAHHASCWRYWHLNDLANAMESSCRN